MIPHARQSQWVQHLQQQRTDAAAKHGGEVTMHLPGDRLRAKQPRIASRIFKINPAECQPGQAEHLFLYRCAYHFHPPVHGLWHSLS
ncbi:hypothetical protein D3C78_1640620 [compost metagenome]